MKKIQSKIFYPLAILVVAFFMMFLFIFGIIHTFLYFYVQKEKSNNYYSFLKLVIHYIPMGNSFELGNTPLKLNPFRTEVLGRNYIKDEKRVYYRDILIEGADAATFELLDEEMYSRDSHNIYIYGIPFKDIDTQSFQKDPNFGSYVRDKQRIYYVDEGDISRNRRNYTFIEALPQKYTILTNEYGTVDGFLYYQGKKIEHSYVEHFEVLIADSGTIIKTKDYINYLGYMVYGIDTESFRILDSSFYFQDTNAIYFGFEELKDGYGQTIGLTAKSILGADKNSFEVIKDKEGYFAKDKNNTYERGIIVMKNEI